MNYMDRNGWFIMFGVGVLMLLVVVAATIMDGREMERHIVLECGEQGTYTVWYVDKRMRRTALEPFCEYTEAEARAECDRLNGGEVK